MTLRYPTGLLLSGPMSLPFNLITAYVPGEHRTCDPGGELFCLKMYNLMMKWDSLDWDCRGDVSLHCRKPVVLCFPVRKPTFEAWGPGLMGLDIGKRGVVSLYEGR